jgi:hypothetical protein
VDGLKRLTSNGRLEKRTYRLQQNSAANDLPVMLRIGPCPLLANADLDARLHL